MQAGQSDYVRKNIKAFKLTTSPRFFLIQPQGKQPSTQLIIQKKTLQIVQQSRDKNFVFNQGNQSTLVSLVLGTLDVLSHNYLVFATEVFLVGKYFDSAVYHIAAVDFLPFGDRPKEGDVRDKTKDILSELQTEVFSFGFYFSFQCDMTLTYRQQLENQETNEMFFWNGHLMKMFKDGGVSNSWRIPIFQGYFGCFQCPLGQVQCQYYLISRRSKYKSGTRFYARGLDDQGNCANSVQTQQVLRFNQRVVSHLMFRGSVPVFWEQRSLSAAIKLTRNKELTKVCFTTHMKKLHASYGRVLCVNLLGNDKAGEQLLTRAYELLFSECFQDLWEFCRYHYYDLHDIVKKNTPEKLNMFIHKRRAVLETFGYFLHDTRLKVALSEQNGIVRVNCLDGLGRSGTLLHKVAFKVLETALKESDISMETIFGREVYEELDSSSGNQFTMQFKILWAENADFLSRMYCGTESYSSNLTRLGKRGLLDFIDSSLLSLARVYNSRFQDKLKQQSLDILLGRVTTTKPVFQDRTHNCPLKVFISTWNVGSVKPSEINLSKLFSHADYPDLVVFALQQMVELNTNNVVLNEQHSASASQKWRLAIEQELEKLGHYIFVDMIRMVGLYTAVFVEEAWKGAVKGVQKDIVKTGAGGQLGNKGGAVVRLRIHDSTICLTNAHLSAGESKEENRVQNVINIHQKAFQQNVPGVQTENKIQMSDFKFLIGDLNFRVDLPAEDVRVALQEMEKLKKKGDVKNSYKLLDFILKHDQLTCQRRNVQCPLYLAAYNQAPILFNPTYKFHKLTNQYQLKKNRVPSWCDRILLWSEYPFFQKTYTSVDLLESDHHPVVAQYTIHLARKDMPLQEIIEVYQDNSTAKEFRDSHFQFL